MHFLSIWFHGDSYIWVFLSRHLLFLLSRALRSNLSTATRLPGTHPSFRARPARACFCRVSTCSTITPTVRARTRKRQSKSSDTFARCAVIFRLRLSLLDCCSTVSRFEYAVFYILSEAHLASAPSSFFSNFHCCFAAQDFEKSALSEACFKIMSTLRIGGNSISLGADPSKTFEQSREFFAILVQNSNAGHSEFHVCFCCRTHHNTSCVRLNFIVPDSKCFL